MKRLWTIFTALVMVGASVCLAWAIKQDPIDVESDRMRLSFDNKTAIFEGKVSVTQGDLTLTCNTLTLQQANQGPIEKVLAEGDVYIRWKKDIVSGNKAIFNPNKELLIVKGDVVLQRATSTLRGSVLRYNLADGTLDLKNTEPGARVKAEINPDDLKKTRLTK